MRRLFFLPAFFFFVTVVTLGLPFVVEAAVTCPANFSPDPSGVCFPTNTGLSSASVFHILTNFMQWLLGIISLIGIIAFVISGIQYLTAAGDERQAETAKTNIKYSIIGIIVALSGYIIITAIDALFKGSATF